MKQTQYPLIALLIMTLSLGVMLSPAETVRPDVWPVGQYQLREGEDTDEFLPGAGLTLSPQASNPGTSQTLYADSGTGWLFYGGDDRTDQLPGRSKSKLTVSPDDPRADYWGPGGLEAALAASDLETTPCMIELWPGTYSVTQKWFLPEGVSLCGRPGQEASTIIQGNNNSVPPGWYNGSAAPTSALFQTLGNNHVENLTMINLRTIYPSVCLYATCASGEYVITRNCSFSGAGLGADALYVRPGNGSTITVEHCSAVDGIDSLSIAPQGTGVALVRDCRFRDTGGNGRSCWISGSGLVVFDQCEFWAASPSLGNWDFNNTFDGGGADVIANGCTFYNGATRLPGRIVTSVTSGTGWGIYQNGCIGAPNYSGAAIIWYDWDATMDEVDANRYRINGVEVIGPTRVGTFAGLDVTGITDLDGTATIQSTLPHLIGTKDQPAGSGIDTALIVQTDFTATPVVYDGTRLLLRVDNGLQTNALALEGILGSDSNEGYGRMAHYPDGVYTPFLQFGGPTASELGNLSNLVSVSTWDTGPTLNIGGVPFAVEASSTITLNQDNIVMSADPATTFGIATRGFVLAQNPTFLSLYLEPEASDVSGYKVMSHDIPSDPTQSIVSGALGVGEHLLATWIGPPEGLGQPVLPAGVIRGHIHAYKTTPGTREVALKLCFAIRTALGVETQLAECVENDALTGTSLPYELQRAIEEAEIDETDRMVIRWYAVVSGVGVDPVVTLEYQGTTDARVEIPSTPGYAASLIAANTFQEDNTFEKSVITNNSKGDHDFAVYGVGAPPIVYGDASTNRLGVGTAFPSAQLDVLGASELNGQTNINGQLLVDSTLQTSLTRSGLTSGSGVTTVIQAIAKYTTTPSVGDGPTIALVADDGTQQTVAAIWGKKTGATSGRLELREQTTGSLVLSAHSEGGVFYTDKTQWHYFDAVGCSGGEVFALGGGGGVAWEPNALTNAAYMRSTLDGISMVFQLPYEAGTILTRLSARNQGGGAGDGVIVTLQERQGGTVAAGWTTVGAAQTWTHTSELNDVYDFADKTMLSGYQYRIQVEAERVTSEARLWEIGIETDQRAY